MLKLKSNTVSDDQSLPIM